MLLERNFNKCQQHVPSSLKSLRAFTVAVVKSTFYDLCILDENKMKILKNSPHKFPVSIYIPHFVSILCRLLVYPGSREYHRILSIFSPSSLFKKS